MCRKIEKNILQCEADLGALYAANAESQAITNPMVLNMLCIWKQAHTSLKLDPWLHESAPFYNNAGILIGGQVVHWPETERPRNTH